MRAEGAPAVSDASVNQAYDAFGYTYSLYWDIFHRDSIDDQGMAIEGLVHYGTDYDNAFWDGAGHMFFGDGDGKMLTDTTKGVDVVGHELTHGVTQNEANLTYSGQSGALNESISDVFGSLVKQYHLGQTAAQADWLIGADIVGPQLMPALRSMKDPGHANPYDNQPASMDNYVHTTSDNGGVHTNSGIPNHAFYVVATTLGGNAWEAPGQVWYDSLSDPRLKPGATFSQFATITLRQARTRYGAGSAEADAVKAGWDAVAVTGALSRARRDAAGYRRGVTTSGLQISYRRSGGFAGIDLAAVGRRRRVGPRTRPARVGALGLVRMGRSGPDNSPGRVRAELRRARLAPRASPACRTASPTS